MKTVRDVCQYVGSVIINKPLCVETGTMYTCPPGNEPHNTTSNILEFVCAPTGGVLYSLDIDPEHIEFSEQWNEEYSDLLYCMEGDSVESLTRLASELIGVNLKLQATLGPDILKVDLLCLDGKEFDEFHMVKEYLAIKDLLAEKHFVLVDDIHNPNSVKWVQMVPMLKELGYSYVEVPTPTGMFVATKGYSL